MDYGRALPCVWMSAGLVAYKLCDRDFDCDNCPLDAALHGRDLPRSVEVDAEAPPERLEFPDDRLYHRAHTWAKAFDGGRVLTGLDAFAARLLEGSTSVILPAVDSSVVEGHVAFWVRDDSQLVPLLAPVTGRLRLCNVRVLEQPSLICASPYDHGWLAEVECSDWSAQCRDLLSADQIRERVGKQMTTLRKRVTRFVTRSTAAVGPTAADGGERLTDARRILGPARYRRLILQLLR